LIFCISRYKGVKLVGRRFETYPIQGDIMAKPGLYENIHRKQERIKAGSGEKMRKVGAKGAPSAKDFKDSAKTAKKPK